MIKLSENLKEKPLYITMENASSTKLFQSGVSLATNKKMREKDLQYHSYIEVSAQESLCKAEKHTDI